MGCYFPPMFPPCPCPLLPPLPPPHLPFRRPRPPPPQPTMRPPQPLTATTGTGRRGSLPPPSLLLPSSFPPPTTLLPPSNSPLLPPPHKPAAAAAAAPQPTHNALCTAATKAFPPSFPFLIFTRISTIAKFPPTSSSHVFPLCGAVVAVSLFTTNTRKHHVKQRPLVAGL